MQKVQKMQKLQKMERMQKKIIIIINKARIQKN